jgi:hypothetical protein
VIPLSGVSHLFAFLWNFSLPFWEELFL